MSHDSGRTDVRVSVGDLKAALADLPDNMQVQVEAKGGGRIKVSLRELVDMEGHAETIVAMVNSNGGSLGFTPLTEELYATESLEVLSNFYDQFRPLNSVVGMGHRLTLNYGDYRMYINSGGNNDACYGKVFDPRVILRMLSAGLLERHVGGYSNGIRMTEAGKKAYEEYQHRS